MKIAIYCQKKDDESISYLESFIGKLIERGQSLALYKDLYKRDFFSEKIIQNTSSFSTYEDLKAEKIDYFFSFGGDGTILSALTIIQDLEIPIVGINLGRLGFLANFNKEDALENINFFLERNENLSIIKRSLLEVNCKNKNIYFPFAANDICITRKETTAMISIDTYIDDKLLSVFWSDGLIISTPTGSTAYSMSCGGPIIEPSCDNFVITPIAPHNLNVRPIVISDSSVIKLKVESRTNLYTLSLDSRLINMDTQDEIYLKKASFSLKLVQAYDGDFFKTLRKKLFWGKDKRN